MLRRGSGQLLRRFLSLTDCSPKLADCTLNKEENMARADRVARRAKRRTRRASRRTARRARRTIPRGARRGRRTGRRAVRQTRRAVRRTVRETKRVGRKVVPARRFPGGGANEQENIGEEGTASEKESTLTCSTSLLKSVCPISLLYRPRVFPGNTEMSA